MYSFMFLLSSWAARFSSCLTIYNRHEARRSAIQAQLELATARPAPRFAPIHTRPFASLGEHGRPGVRQTQEFVSAPPASVCPSVRQPTSGFPAPANCFAASSPLIPDGIDPSTGQQRRLRYRKRRGRIANLRRRNRRTLTWATIRTKTRSTGSIWPPGAHSCPNVPPLRTLAPVVVRMTGECRVAAVSRFVYDGSLSANDVSPYAHTSPLYRRHAARISRNDGLQRATLYTSCMHR